MILTTPETKMPYDFSADGRFLLYGTLNGQTGADIWALPLTGDQKPFPVVQANFAEDAAQFSPDAKWIAYESNETGRFEIYVQAFPAAHGKWQISTGGGTLPRWHDRNELVYVSTDGHLTAVTVSVAPSGESIDPATPVSLFAARFASGGNVLTPGALARPLYALAADGRFLLNEAVEDAVTTPLTIVLNWDAELPK